MSQDKAARIPKAGARVDLRSLPIGPEEAFVFSRVDGVSSEAEIALGTGLSEERVRLILLRLEALGAVQKDAAAAPADTTLKPQTSGAHALRTSEIPSTLRSPKGASQPAKPAEPAAGASTLSQEIRRELLALDENLAQKDHYQVLGLSRGADRQAIKSAYFALITRFHPDRHYGKDLSLDKAQLERVIARLTEAYDTLTRTQLRTEYNASLPPAADSANALPQVPPVANPSPETPPAGTSSKPSQTSSKPFDSQTRKRALARRLSTSVQPQPSRTSMTLQAMGATRPGSTAETVPALRVETRATTSSRRYELAAEQALKEQNPIAAANSLRLALSINPDDASLKLRLEQAQAEADTRLKDRLESDARNAEQAGKYSEAAVLYGRAARGGKSAELFYKAAECSLLAADNPRLAAEFAKGGLLLAPNHARLHLLLGRIYADAGMTASALAELEKAKRLSPDDDTIDAWLERVKKRRE